MEKQYFKDISPFCGVKEFHTPDEGTLRCMSKGFGIWDIYTKDEEGLSFIKQKTIRLKRSASYTHCITLYKAFQALDEEDYRW